ncbi:class F sortase [Aquibacillus rhizosphaerae]|uniref:Class F sortase n=1 Tax=Aquibacillus rhizosphaerae TaxID=3051431 RepID=A0ABT7L5N5_9BACI|nr:class F sortase [Aquibacillus sp. LR5S19]MDL4841182.1 class F sortase [Aquibacillus sp. LR5S19]
MPGDRGSAVIACHVDDKTAPAVFFHLKDLKQDDEIIITNDSDEKLIFKVDKQVFPMDDAPFSEIAGYTSRQMLNLITCTGPFD